MRLAHRLLEADGRAWKRGIRLHGDIARGLARERITHRVQCSLFLPSGSVESRRSPEVCTARPWPRESRWMPVFTLEPARSLFYCTRVSQGFLHTRHSSRRRWASPDLRKS